MACDSLGELQSRRFEEACIHDHRRLIDIEVPGFERLVLPAELEVLEPFSKRVELVIRSLRRDCKAVQRLIKKGGWRTCI